MYNILTYVFACHVCHVCIHLCVYVIDIKNSQVMMIMYKICKHTCVCACVCVQACISRKHFMCADSLFTYDTFGKSPPSVCVCVCVCARARAFVCVRARVCARVSVCTMVYTTERHHKKGILHADMFLRAHACMHTYIKLMVAESVLIDVENGNHHIHTYIHTYLYTHTHIHTHTYTYIHIYIKNKQRYIHTHA
jgi:hypothetical protein